MRQNIEGFEFYSGIPGSIGGAVKMNAGCYGSEIKDIIVSVQAIDFNGKVLTVGNMTESELVLRQTGWSITR